MGRACRRCLTGRVRLSEELLEDVEVATTLHFFRIAADDKLSRHLLAYWPLSRSAHQDNVLGGCVVSFHGAIGLNSVSQWPCLDGRGPEMASLKACAQSIHDLGDLLTGKLRCIDTDQALTLVVEVHEIELDASVGNASRRSGSFASSPRSP